MRRAVSQNSDCGIPGSGCRDIRPATTIVEVARLIDDDAQIEIEADAIVA